MNPVDLKADCSQCAALCCMALAFDDPDAFPFEKEPGIPCPHLDGHKCGIFGRRESHGMKGCAPFDCHGAGQYVTQSVFDGRSWQSEPDLLERQVRAFTDMLRVQQLALLLDEASKLDLSGEQRAVLDDLQGALWPEGGWDEWRLAAFRSSGVDREVHRFLQTLKDLVS